ncbi:MAG: helix-turn-helix transcriptional regulator [Gammaproteobacteria bacterium]|nr:helix-turn-helix transcriptional regulator [Gammaproteobacteria bacterium]
MDQRDAFAQSLRALRQAKRLTQEDFDHVSSRTYISLLERGEKSPTLDKISQLASVLRIHPLTLLTLVYMNVAATKSPDILFNRVSSELTKLQP